MARQGDRHYRELFFAWNGPGPYICVECLEPVDFYGVLVHHANHDERDHRLVNLVPMHRGCHTKHHSTGRDLGKKASEETKAKMREAGRRRWAAMTPEQRSAVGQKAADTRAPKQQDVHKRTWETRRKKKDD